MSAFIRQYGADAIVDGIPVINYVGEYMTGAPLAAGDVTISIDGGAVASMSLPASFQEVPAGSRRYRLIVAAGLMACQRAIVDIVDQTTPKAFVDQRVIIETDGHASSMHPSPIALDTAGIVEALEEALTDAHGDGSWQAKTIIASGSNTDVAVRIDEDLTAGVGKMFVRSFLAEGVISTDSLEFAFTVKAVQASDSDDDALIAIRKTVAGASDDGLFRYLRGDVLAGDRGRGKIIVDSLTPSTLITVRISGLAMMLPPGDYSWELTRWRPVDGIDEAEPFGAGVFTVERLARLGAPRP